MRITYLNRRAQKEIKAHVEANYELIPHMRPGFCRLNLNCHFNTVHDAMRNGDRHIAMVVYFPHTDPLQPIIHFVNIDKWGNLIDNTLGYWATQNRYYLIEFIPQEDFLKIDAIFGAFRNKLDKELKPLTRLLSNYRG